MNKMELACTIITTLLTVITLICTILSYKNKKYCERYSLREIQISYCNEIIYFVNLHMATGNRIMEKLNIKENDLYKSLVFLCKDNEIKNLDEKELTKENFLSFTYCKKNSNVKKLENGQWFM